MGDVFRWLPIIGPAMRLYRCIAEVYAVCNSSYFDLIPIPILSVFPYPNPILTDPDYILMQILILSYNNVIILTTPGLTSMHNVHSASISLHSSGVEHRVDYRCNHHYPYPVLP